MTSAPWPVPTRAACGSLPPALSVNGSECSEREQQQQRDQQREDAQRFGDGEPKDQVAELALRGGRIAQGGGKIMAEDRAHADARATHADAGNAGANVLRGDWIHDETPFRG